MTAKPDARLRDVIDQMKALGISQLPVVDHGKMRGIVAEVDLLRALVTGGKTLDTPIAEVVEDDYATVTPNTKIELLQGVLADAKVAIVEDARRNRRHRDEDRPHRLPREAQDPAVERSAGGVSLRASSPTAPPAHPPPIPAFPPQERGEGGALRPMVCALPHSCG